MKKQKNIVEDEVVTTGFLAEQFEKFGREQDEKAREYRDQILNKLDGIVGELEQIREDQLFAKHDITDLQQRMGKLEQSSQAR